MHVVRFQAAHFMYILEIGLQPNIPIVSKMHQHMIVADKITAQDSDFQKSQTILRSVFNYLDPDSM